MRINQPGLADTSGAIAFVRVVEKGTFRGAAAVLGVPSSTVSRRVAALEDQVGVRLLERTTRSVRVTEAGREYFADVGPAVQVLERAGRSLRARSERPRGLVRLSAPVMFGQLVLSEVLPGLLAQYPEIELAIDLQDRVVSLVDEGTDVAIRSGALEDSGLRARRLGETAIGFFCSPSYLQRRGAPRTPSDLAAHDILRNGTIERPSPWRFQVDDRIETLDPRARAIAPDFVILRSLCMHGLGIARLPEFLVRAAVERGELVPVLRRFSPPAVPISVVWLGGRNVPARTRVVVDVLSRMIPHVLALHGDGLRR